MVKTKLCEETRTFLEDFAEESGMSSGKFGLYAIPEEEREIFSRLVWRPICHGIRISGHALFLSKTIGSLIEKHESVNDLVKKLSIRISSKKDSYDGQLHFTQEEVATEGVYVPTGFTYSDLLFDPDCMNQLGSYEYNSGKPITVKNKWIYEIYKNIPRAQRPQYLLNKLKDPTFLDKGVEFLNDLVESAEGNFAYEVQGQKKDSGETPAELIKHGQAIVKYYQGVVGELMSSSN